MWRTSRRWCHRCSGAGAGRSTQHGRGADGRFPATGRPPRLPATRPSAAGHATTGHDAARLRPDAATGHASARSASTRHASAGPSATGHAPAGPSATGHAPARPAPTRHATARIPTPTSRAKRPGSSPQQVGHAASACRSFVGQRRRQFGSPPGRPLHRWGHDHRAQPFRFSHRCHREQLG